VDDLSARHERGAAEPWSTKLLDARKRDGLLAAIVGLTIVIDRLEGKRKLSQNKSQEDFERVRQALLARGSDDDRQMARAMGEEDITSSSKRDELAHKLRA
jgi:transcriptional regulator